MLSRFNSLKDKLEDIEYLDSISNRVKSELRICKEYLSEEELGYYSSVTTGYKIARHRYIEDHFGTAVVEEQERRDRPSIFVRYNSI